MNSLHASYRRIAPVALALCVLLPGCATPQRPDPMEAMNRKVFAFNESVDKAVLAPVARGYVRTVPDPVRRSVGNVLANPMDIGSALNLFLQGRPIDGLSDVARVATNTTVGVLGIFDVATPLGLARHGEDFGQTLGRWGFNPGAYVVWPLLGPSSVRESVAIPVDLVSSPSFGVAAMPLQFVHTRSTLLSVTSMLDDIALDRYLFVRDAYLQRRQSLVHDGNPPNDSTAVSPARPDSFNPQDLADE